MSETRSPSLFNIGSNLPLQRVVCVCLCVCLCVCVLYLVLTVRCIQDTYRHLSGTWPSYPRGVCVCFHMNYSCCWGCESCVAIIFVDIYMFCQVIWSVNITYGELKHFLLHHISVLREIIDDNLSVLSQNRTLFYNNVGLLVM